MIDGWSGISDYPGLRDGVYCPVHTAAIQAEFDEGDEDKRDDA
jgi:hypothetical protein